MPITGEGRSSGVPCLIKVVEGVLEHDEEIPLAGFTFRIYIGDNLVELVPCLNQIVFYTSVVHIFLHTERSVRPRRTLCAVGVERLVRLHCI